MADKPVPENPFESKLEPLSDEEMAKLEKSRSETFEAEPPSRAMLARLEKATADRREKERAASAARKSNRAVGALVLIPAFGLVTASFLLHDPSSSFTSTISWNTAMALRIGGLMLGLTGFRMLFTGSRE